MAGRPKEDITSLPKNWHKSVLSLYQEGASDVEIKAWVYQQRGSFSNDLWDRWMAEEPEFSETIKMGKMVAEAFWHKNGRINLKDRDFNYTGWYMQMKNRYGWKDKVEQENTGKDGGPIQNEHKHIIQFRDYSDGSITEL